MASDPEDEHRTGAVSRRSFLKGAGGVAAGGLAAPGLAAGQDAGGVETLRGSVRIELSINGTQRSVAVEPRTTLLGALRDHLEPALTGTKLVCGHGTCGACTVLLDGKPVYGCLQLAVDAVGREITTVEGLAAGGALSPVQEAFCEHDGLMCGFCTPGFLMSVTACLERDPGASEDDVRAACAGNLCRCGTYPQVFEAALAAGRELRGAGGTEEGR